MNHNRTIGIILPVELVSDDTQNAVKCLLCLPDFGGSSIHFLFLLWLKYQLIFNSSKIEIELVLYNDLGCIALLTIHYKLSFFHSKKLKFTLP